jgi:hypothetical protein
MPPKAVRKVISLGEVSSWAVLFSIITFISRSAAVWAAGAWIPAQSGGRRLEFTQLTK